MRRVSHTLNAPCSREFAHATHSFHFIASKLRKYCIFYDNNHKLIDDCHKHFFFFEETEEPSEPTKKSKKKQQQQNR